MFSFFRDTLIKFRRNFITLKGSEEERFTTAVNHIDQLLKP